MAAHPVPTLGLGGWVTAVSEKLDSALAHFFASDYYQTAIYKDQVSSLPYIIQENNKDPSVLASTIRSTLTAYLTRYFDSTSVDVDVVEIPETSGLEIRVYATVTENGKEYTVATLIATAGVKIQKIMTINNT